jgi:hypothetical protein
MAYLEAYEILDLDHELLKHDEHEVRPELLFLYGRTDPYTPMEFHDAMKMIMPDGTFAIGALCLCGVDVSNAFTTQGKYIWPRRRCRTPLCSSTRAPSRVRWRASWRTSSSTKRRSSKRTVMMTNVRIDDGDGDQIKHVVRTWEGNRILMAVYLIAVHFSLHATRHQAHYRPMKMRGFLLRVPVAQRHTRCGDRTNRKMYRRGCSPAIGGMSRSVTEYPRALSPQRT